MMSMKRLPWSSDSYRLLDPADLKPVPAPTPEQRVRVAAALATLIRDARMLGKDANAIPNSEAIRAVLVMDAEAWARDIVTIARIVTAYDDKDPKLRFEQIQGMPSGDVECDS
jgi:hypothetical protein